MSRQLGLWILFFGALLVAMSVWIADPWPARAPASLSFTSLAVLPFDSQKNSPVDPSLATGLSLDLLLRLQNLGSLQCIPRGQISTWQRQDLPRFDLARLVGAEVLVRGTVGSHSGQVKLELEIEDARSRSLLARMELTESRERILDLQRRAAVKVVEALALPVPRSELRRLEANSTRSLKAWDYAVQGQVYLEDTTNPRGPAFATDRFRRAIQHDPDFGLAQVGLSRALWQGHVLHGAPAKLTEAELTAREVLGRHPSMTPATVILTQILLTARRSNAIGETLLLPEIQGLAKPDEALRHVASELMQVGQLNLAEGALRSAESVAGDFWLNSYTLAQFLLRSGRQAEGAAALARATQTSPPENIWSQEQLIGLRLAAGDLQGATQIFERLQINRVELETLRGVAAAYTLLEQLSAAQRIYERALVLAPADPQIFLELGDVLMRQDLLRQAEARFAEGLRILTMTLEDHPTDTAARLQSAVLAAKLRRCPDALSQADSLLHQQIESPAVLRDLAVVFALCQKPEKAVELLRIALEYGLATAAVQTRPEFRHLLERTDLQTALEGATPSPPSP